MDNVLKKAPYFFTPMESFESVLLRTPSKRSFEIGTDNKGIARFPRWTGKGSRSKAWPAP